MFTKREKRTIIWTTVIAVVLNLVYFAGLIGLALLGLSIAGVI